MENYKVVNEMFVLQRQDLNSLSTVTKKSSKHLDSQKEF